MSHHIYQTKAYIIDSFEIGEANKKLVMLTEDLGLIQVIAQGVRLGKSKLKASIQDLSFSKVSVVRGKEVWRLTNAEKLISLYDKRVPLVVRQLLSLSLQFIRRLTPEDMKIEALFVLMNQQASFCFQHKEIASSYTNELGILFQTRVLEILGYGSSYDSATQITGTPEITVAHIEHVSLYKKELVGLIEAALIQSHL
jgi:recombinational DNA repair protein (RecF pathway)